MKVTLLTSHEHFKDMEQNAAIATLTCHANTNKEFNAPDVLGRIIKAGHESILEHITLVYSVKSLSRACLQELARHRHISLSVESTRHTLKQHFKECCIPISFPDDMEKDLRAMIAGYLQAVSTYLMLHPDVPNDQLKYAIPEAVSTDLILTANVRELRHIIELRTSPAALKEFRELAYSLYEAVPEEFRYLLADCVYKEEKENDN